MKDLSHLFLSTCDIGVNLSMLRRFNANADVDEVPVQMGLAPNNHEQVDCPYLMVTLRRIGTPGVKHFDDVYVMGHLTPAAIDDIKTTDGKIDPNESRSCYVVIVPHHCGERTYVLKLRRNYLGKFVSIQHNGHATKGGVYGNGMFGCEYIGIFKSMPEMYKALRDIYPDL